MFKKSCLLLVVLFLSLLFLPSPASAALVFDRGLPTANLNLNTDADPGNDADKSNVIIWANQGFLGDDFTIGTSGESWTVDKIRVWTDEYKPPEGTGAFSDEFNNLKLYGSLADTTLNLLSSGNFTSGNETDNTDITITRVQYANGQDVFSEGAWKYLLQVDFDNLNWSIDGGLKYQFAVNGEGKSEGNLTWIWTHHGSNKDLSGSPQAGADDQIRYWAGPLAVVELLNLQTIGAWDKPADINVQIWAHRQSSAETTCTITNTGPRSKNICTIDNKKTVKIKNSQRAKVINNVSSVANSGGIKTGANGQRNQAGAATSTVNITNTLNRSIIRIQP